VDRYLEQQLHHGDFADSRYRDALADLSYTDFSIKPTEPIMTKSGRYLLAYHYVFVTAGRWRMPRKTAEVIQTAFRKVSLDSQWKIGKLAMMPDHVHLAIKGVPESSPQDIGLRIQDECSRAVGTHGFWMPNWYMGTFGRYGMGGVRAAVNKL
jgi:REP element-mobilizing transposase RayT